MSAKSRRTLLCILCLMAALPAMIRFSPVKAQTAINVSLPQVSGAANTELIVPIGVGDLSGRGVISYDAALTFNAAVLQPLEPVFETAGTVSSSMSITINSSQTGRLLISAFGTAPLSGSGSLLRLRFKIVGQSGQTTALTWQNFTFNGGTPAATPSNGSVTVGSSTPVNRALRVRPASGSPGGNVTVVMELVAQGDENALGFSLTYDPAVLSNPQSAPGSDAAGVSLNPNTLQIAQGNLGLVLALPSGQAFPAGTRAIVNVSFAVAANAPTTTQIAFGDQPIVREIAGVNAAVLPANYTGGTITITQGFEADVAPRPNGNNGLLTVTDWVQVGRFVAGQDTAAAGGEFQRADCAPRDARGDGRLTVSDWAQAGRYAAGADAAVAAGGPTAPTNALTVEALPGSSDSTAQQLRNVRIAPSAIERGQSGAVVVELDALGDENAFGFSLTFDPAQLRFVSAAPGRDAAGALLHINSFRAAEGRVGVALALPAGQSFAGAARQILSLNFAVAANGNAATTMIAFGDQPVASEVASVSAAVLPAIFNSGTVTMTRTAAGVSAASFTGGALAAETIAAAFGANLATAVAVADGLPLPTQLAGTSVRIKDSAGREGLAPLFFVAPSQVNFLMPSGLAVGTATLTVSSGDGAVSEGRTMIGTVAPGLFTANASGQGLAAATVLRVRTDGSLGYEAVSRFDAALGKSVSVPIDLSDPAEQVFLLLFGTGFRGRSSLGAVGLLVGGLPVEALYAGPQGDFAGLDQINLPLPRALAGRGEVTISLTVDGKTANPVTITFR